VIVRQKETFENCVLRHDGVVVLLVGGAGLGKVLGQFAAGPALRQDQVNDLDLLLEVANIQIPNFVFAV
jgi:hypothetical protein